MAAGGLAQGRERHALTPLPGGPWSALRLERTDHKGAWETERSSLLYREVRRSKSRLLFPKVLIAASVPRARGDTGGRDLAELLKNAGRSLSKAHAKEAIERGVGVWKRAGHSFGKEEKTLRKGHGVLHLAKTKYVGGPAKKVREGQQKRHTRGGRYPKSALSQGSTSYSQEKIHWERLYQRGYLWGIAPDDALLSS